MPRTAGTVAIEFSRRQTTGSSDYRIVYNFKASPDGASPDATLLADKGKLYGTTSGGGKNGYGTVYEMDNSGKEHVLYGFKGAPDGAGPLGELVDVGGKFYGTTANGGANGDGTVFAVTTSGREKVLYSFKGRPDGANPYAGLAAVNDVLYGTTWGGGSDTCKPSSSGYYGCGVVFKVTLSGKERVLHRFEGVKKDGAAPFAPLLAIEGTLYGTASEGGASNAGVVYEIDTSGRERILYSFKGQPDGSYPTAGLTADRGLFFGTTQFGGTYGGTGGWGTVFRVTETGNKERAIFSFGGSVGSLPYAGVLAVNGKLYGTTDVGLGGTAYEMSLSGNAHLLHHFTGPPDGDGPAGGLTYLNGSLFGTTANGGSNRHGTVFKILR
jgi:uncharacterized repeat protein (TIGR03803 family)